jgi:hypothetical protein
MTELDGESWREMPTLVVFMSELMQALPDVVNRGFSSGSEIVGEHQHPMISSTVFGHKLAVSTKGGAKYETTTDSRCLPHATPAIPPPSVLPRLRMCAPILFHSLPISSVLPFFHSGIPRYPRHLDNVTGSADLPGGGDDLRKLTAVYYMNGDWDAEQQGGSIRLYDSLDPDDPYTDVAPAGEGGADRIVLFWADLIAHEVLPMALPRVCAAAAAGGAGGGSAGSGTGNGGAAGSRASVGGDALEGSVAPAEGRAEGQTGKRPRALTKKELAIRKKAEREAAKQKEGEAKLAEVPGLQGRRSAGFLLCHITRLLVSCVSCVAAGVAPHYHTRTRTGTDAHSNADAPFLTFRLYRLSLPSLHTRVLALAFNQAAEQQAAVYAAERAREEEANYRHTFTVWLTTENPASLNDRRSPLHPLRVAHYPEDYS